MGWIQQAIQGTMIEAGVEYLKWLDEQFEEKVPDSTERIKFVLA